MLLLDFNPLVSSRLADGGPQYFETNLHRVIAEPWNAFSSLAFLIPVALFLWKLKGHYRENIFLIFVCAPLLAIGGIGSTLFHALRSSPFFLMLDVFPIALLTLSLSLWFCYKLIPKWYFLLIFFIFFAGIRSVSFYFMHGQAAINLSYFLSGLMIFVPGLFYLFRTKFLTVRWLILSILLFSIALIFRFTDDFPRQLLPMGVHWLWHISCAAGALFLGKYVILFPGNKPSLKNSGELIT